MATVSNPLALSQQVVMKAAQDVSLRMLDAMTKLVQLNLETTRSMITDASEKAVSTVEAGRLPDAQSLAARPSTQEMNAYVKRVMDIVTETNIDLVAVMQKHALGFGPDAFAMAAKNSLTAGNDTMAAVPNPFGAAQDAVRQASETMTEAAKSMMQPKQANPAAA